MSEPNGEPNPQNRFVPPQKTSGIRTVLRYTGIPPSWLDKRPKLPSRNWLIFLSVTSTITGYYVYDRYQCKRIRQQYADKVKELADLPSSSLDKARKVTVYGSKWPGDEDYDQSLRYFRKYVKPVLVAAAVDYETVGAKRLGELSNRVANEVRLRRRKDLGIDKDSDATLALPTYEPLADRRKRELEGGVIIVGRPTWKEYLHGLHRGWTDGLRKVDEDEVLARELEDDGHFDEPEEVEGSTEQPSSRPPIQLNPSLYSPLRLNQDTRQKTESSSDTLDVSPPSVIPPLPPVLLVPFTNYLGILQIPLMIWDFFNERYKVKSGSQAAYQLVMNNTRPIIPPSLGADPLTNDPPSDISQGDLDFDKQCESYYKKSLNSIPDEIEKARKKYYEELPKRLETARALIRGTREPTKEELSNPPPTEVELRQERLNKERKWRNDLIGWNIVKPETPAVWDDRLIGALQIFTTSESSDDSSREI